MHYVSTRGDAPSVDFEGVLLAGLAPDGGLYVPETWPSWSLNDLRAQQGRSYAEVATWVLAPFVAPTLSLGRLETLVREAYAGFSHAEVAPLRTLSHDTWLLELFHGPTLAFKDIALQLLGRIFDEVLQRRGERLTLLGATSGDTGPAAIEGCKGRDNIDVFILHPLGRTSEVQRRQMTTVHDPHVHNVAIEGTFDDAQAIVKAMFRDHATHEALQLGAVNSINWARVLAQIVYYVTSALALGAPDRKVRFVVPTGNFGDVFAGWCAQRMGLPIDRLVVASNENDILTRVLTTGVHALAEVVPTSSPSMDIQVSSNFERALFEACDRDGARVRGWFEKLNTDRSFTIDDRTRAALRASYDAGSLDQAGTLATIRTNYLHRGVLLDPHTAVGVGVAAQLPANEGVSTVVLATAHPSKFPDAVEAATGTRPKLPPHLADLFDREERYDVLPATVEAVKAYVSARARAAKS